MCSSFCAKRPCNKSLRDNSGVHCYTGITKTDAEVTAMIDIGKNIRFIRESRSMTQEELANQLFVSRQTVSNYETGRTKPDIEMLAKLAEILKADIHDLIYGTADIYRRRKMVTRFCIAAGCVATMLISWPFLSRWAQILKNNEYRVIPWFIVSILYQPFILFCTGWTFLQGLGTFCQLRPFKAAARWVRIGVLTAVTAYLVIMVPLVLGAVYAIPIPMWWSKLAYWILGALAGRNAPSAYLGIAFITGAFFWMSSAEAPDTFHKKV